jgi:transitional endoplasmic reticulum ATPase
MLAMREHISKYAEPKEADAHVKELEIHMRHFEEAMKKIRPLSTQELNMYKRMAEQFGKPELSPVGGGTGAGSKPTNGTVGTGTPGIT